MEGEKRGKKRGEEEEEAEKDTEEEGFLATQFTSHFFKNMEYMSCAIDKAD